MSHFAIAVHELEPGEFHFTLLEPVNEASDYLSFRPLEVDSTPYQSEMEAWVAATCMINERMVRPLRPSERRTRLPDCSMDRQLIR